MGMMLGTFLYWVTLIILTTRLKITRQCAATAPNNPPEMPSQQENPVTSPTTSSNGSTGSTGMPCGRCQHLPVRRTDNNSRPVTQTDGTGPDSCPTITASCEGNATDQAVILTWYDSNGMDVGSTFGSGTVTAVLTCTTSNQLTLQGGIVNEVECISA
ncbi:c6 domain-containing protein [Ditylenchus destructor]|nr:c6 domain-containing protein [Ditylenchus destructor]